MIGEPQAKVGSEFYFLGSITECKDCRLKGACFNLKPGSRYRVIEVRSQKHACPECEEVVVVEVEKVPTPAAVPKKGAMEGATITYTESRCDEISCPNFGLCHPVGKKDGQKYTIARLGSDLECPIGEKMVGADLYRFGTGVLAGGQPPVYVSIRGRCRSPKLDRPSCRRRNSRSGRCRI